MSGLASAGYGLDPSAFGAANALTGYGSGLAGGIPGGNGLLPASDMSGLAAYQGLGAGLANGVPGMGVGVHPLQGVSLRSRLSLDSEFHCGPYAQFKDACFSALLWDQHQPEQNVYAASF